ncbi:MAG: hypothetical protein AAGI15_04015 [Pseudomonadota bacterium]
MPTETRWKPLRCAVLLLAGSLPLGANADEPPPEPAEVVQDQLRSEKLGDRVMPDARDWRLDPSVFTGLAPFTAPESAIALPEDQRE